MLTNSLFSWYKKKNKRFPSWELFLALFILSHLPVVSIGGISTPFLMVGIGGGVVTLAAITISQVWKERKTLALILFVLITISNLAVVINQGKQGQTILEIQKDMTLYNEISALDYIYKEANREKFSINTLTRPLWINTTWSYLFNWYGKDKYGYLPYWRGRDQVGQLGNNLENAPQDIKLHFFIIEPPQGIPGYFYNQEIEAENARSKVLTEVNFGELRVQKRIILKNE